MNTTICTTIMVCFDGSGRIKKYNSSEEILKEFYDYRLEYYYKRKINHELEFGGLSRSNIIKLLEEKDFQEILQMIRMLMMTRISGYNYLMKSSSWSFCKEEAQKLMNKKAEKEREFEDLREKAPQQMWIEISWSPEIQKQYKTKEVQVVRSSSNSESPELLDKSPAQKFDEVKDVSVLLTPDQYNLQKYFPYKKAYKYRIPEWQTEKKCKRKNCTVKVCVTRSAKFSPSPSEVDLVGHSTESETKREIFLLILWKPFWKY
ncbi:hypothetical protein C1645_830172 [Glomus cerebriforme]|uniref:DNA topoisomerase (ATP-hydrolyzing) n=1 Tax=Glomus cerebriforme TaxID=658196 RepID=A0A397SJN9_9GLOM|nr:hypothetical protein C1645_830172 [Glomus cerebriforme]